MSILLWFLLIFTVVVLILVILNVPVSQRVINILILAILLVDLVSHSGFISGLHY